MNSPRVTWNACNTATPALELRGLTKRYDDGLLALDAVDLVVPAGEFFGLLGPNGAGKTTLISAVCNLIRTTAGEARVFGHRHDSTEARRMIGLAEQDINLDRFLDVEETLVYHGGYYGMSRADARRRAGEMIDIFDLRAKATTRAPKLSGGMRRRLLLARALMHEPRLVILDEPTAGVDFELRLELWRYIRRLHSEGTTILLTTHYLEEAEELCEDIALIRGGRVIARDTADGLRATYDADSLADVYVKAMAGRRRVKLTIVGGGGFRVPLVYGALLAKRDALPFDEVVLHDVDAGPHGAHGGVLRGLAARARRRAAVPRHDRPRRRRRGRRLRVLRDPGRAARGPRGRRVGAALARRARPGDHRAGRHLLRAAHDPGDGRARRDDRRARAAARG